MRQWIYRWLPIVFGCHCRQERSFHVHGEPFPICARCTGELAGLLLAGMSYALWHPPLPMAALILLPMVLDGGVQMLTRYESNNPRRFATGLLFGYGLACLFLATTGIVFRYGFALGENWRTA